MVRLVLALHGHPDAGGFWEQRCEEVVKQCGWARTSWASLYVHKKTMSLLIIYVDDFRMAAEPEYTVWSNPGLGLIVVFNFNHFSFHCFFF